VANEEQLAILKNGVAEWNEWRSTNPTRVVDLSGAILVSADLHGADLHGADLTNVSFVHADLSDANLTGVDFSDANLNAANFHGANLVRANFTDASLKHANFTGARLCGAILTYANLRGADLSEADLTSAHLSGAILIDVDLRGATLVMTNFYRAVFNNTDLTGANLDLAQFGQTVVVYTDLSVASNVDSCQHVAPSQMGLDTLMDSQPLPEVFLRGCGLSDQLITYLPSLRNQAIEFYSCFISYSTRDQEFAERLYADLQSRGVRCWYAPHHVQGGRKLHEQIDEAIRVHDKLLLVLSEASMESEWVRTEIAKARTREISERRRMLFPVRLVDFARLQEWECFDADAGKDSAREIREYYVPDFSRWKDHDSYHVELVKLLNDLKSR